jgi:CO/xanthine dehydrogenase Mo-binding subunit
VTVFTSKVELGTGIQTALAQIAAEELDVSWKRIKVIMGTPRSPSINPPPVAAAPWNALVHRFAKLPQLRARNCCSHS